MATQSLVENPCRVWYEFFPGREGDPLQPAGKSTAPEICPFPVRYWCWKSGGERCPDSSRLGGWLSHRGAGMLLEVGLVALGELLT